MGDVEAWLMAGDPAVAWQTQRDLLGRAPRTWKATRRRVASEGWGARLLAERDDDGTWGGGLYTPKWTSTFYTLRLLTQLGLPPNHRGARASCELLLDRGVSDAGGVSLWTRSWTDTCVTGMLLWMASYYGFASDERVSRMTRWLLGQQMNDGGWNCNYRDGGGATHSSFHTTVSTLEGLAALQRAAGSRADVETAAGAGRAFFLDHQLYRSSRTGEEVKASFARFSFPPRWFFDVLRGLEHFADVDAPWDERLSDPVALLADRRGRDGRWKTQNKHTGKTYFELEPARVPSRMNTLRALRVQRWLDRVRR
jgi:hypothetical protein